MNELEMLRDKVCNLYYNSPFPPTGCGASFGELLCHEIHGPSYNLAGELCEQGLTFLWLAEKWGITVAQLGELIYDHCKRLVKTP
jgi:hypothetical protein